MIVDTDTASDDAVALIMALREPAVEVVAITVVAGNVPLPQASRNARYTVELCGAEVPVHEGATGPLKRDLQTATFFHGEDGLGDRGYPPPRRPPAAAHAVPALVAAIRAHPGVVLVTLGPLTNVALALAEAPDIAPRVGRCVVMGGAACTVGNVTPAAEYNIWCDPEAAQACFRSGLPIEMVGWELSREDANLDNRSLFRAPGISLPDPVAMAVALDPEVVTRRSRHAVDVECEGTLTRGMTVVDQLDVVRRGLADAGGWRPEAASEEPSVTVCWEIDVPRFKERLFRALS